MIFLSDDVHVETFLGALYFPHKIQLQIDHGFTKLTIRQHLSLVTFLCFHLLYTSFLFLSSVRTSLLMHVGLLLPLLLRMDLP